MFWIIVLLSLLLAIALVISGSYIIWRPFPLEIETSTHPVDVAKRLSKRAAKLGFGIASLMLGSFCLATLVMASLHRVSGIDWFLLMLTAVLSIPFFSTLLGICFYIIAALFLRTKFGLAYCQYESKRPQSLSKQSLHKDIVSICVIFIVSLLISFIIVNRMAAIEDDSRNQTGLRTRQLWYQV
jgi:phage shock protein PspC (stress-responsive transcriptional regulator)